MLRSNIRNSLLGTCAVAALMLGASNGAHAQVTQVNGGGSTLAAVIYQTIFNKTLLPLDPSVNFNYDPVGSGTGARALLCNDATQVGLTAGTAVQYGATDNPLAQNQIDTWNASHAIQSGGGSNCSPANTGTIGVNQGGPLIQVPTIGTPVTIAYNIPTKVGGSTPQLANGGLTFTDAQLCGIFSSKITSWTDAALSGIYTSTGRNQAPSGRINVVFRSDGSGTSALFTAHMAAVCSPSQVPAGFTFSSTQTFAQLFSASTVTMPTYWVGASGSGSVAAQIGPYKDTSGQTFAGNPNSIGYLSPDYTQQASVNTGTPTFPPAAEVFNSHITGGAALLPNYTNTVAALNTATMPSGLNGTSFLPAQPDPHVGYPIVGYTTILLATCYNDPTGEIGVGIAEFLDLMYSDANTINLIQGQGFAQLPLALSNLVNNNILSNNGENIDIEDPAAGCGSTYAGR